MFSCSPINSESNATKIDLLYTESDPCSEFKLEQQLSRRVHLFYLDYDYRAVGFLVLEFVTFFFFFDFINRMVFPPPTVSIINKLNIDAIEL